MRRFHEIILFLLLGMMSTLASAQSSSQLLSLNYTLNESTAPGLFANPSRTAGVYFSSGSDFVESAFTLDQTRGAITYIVSRNGVATLFGVYGDQAGEITFNAPEGIDIDASGNLYIADTGNNQVVRMSFDFQTGAFTHISNFTGLTNPVDVLITGSSLWVLSASQHRVSEYTLSGSFLYSLGSFGSGNGQFSSPCGISARVSSGAISATDIYVVDTGNDRVVMFTKGGSNGTYSAWHAIAIPNSDLYDISSDPDGNAFVADRGQGRIHVVGWYGRDYLGYASENFNQPRSINFAPGYYDVGLIEAWSTSSGVSRYYTGVEILNLTASPGSTSASFNYNLIANATMTGKVLNANGQTVKNLFTNTALPAYSNHQHTWDGRDNSGNTAPGGQYKFELIANTSHGVDTNFVNFTWSPSVGDTTPPTISNVATSNISSSGATITWTTNEASDSQVEYGLTTSYGNATALDGSLVISHSVILSGLSANMLYHYRVKSKDANGNLAVSSDFTFTTATSGGGGNLAFSATASASSEKPQYGQTANKAIDGVIDGWPGDHSKEWASNNQGNGAWIQLNFPQAYTIDKIVLYDRPTTGVHITAGQLSFSNNSTFNTGSLNNNGSAKTVTFSSRTVTWVRFTVNGYSGGSDVGLAEMEVWTASAAKAGDEEFSAAQPAAELPLEFELSPVYPNPFAQREGSATQFHVHLPEAGQVSAVIYNVLGEEVQRVYSGAMPAGRHALRWEGKNALGQNVSAGLYLVRVEFVGSTGRTRFLADPALVAQCTCFGRAGSFASGDVVAGRGGCKRSQRRSPHSRRRRR